MELNEIASEIRQIILTRLDLDLEGEEPGDEASLFEDWGIDSVDVLDLVLGIEQVFSVKIKQDEEIEQHFASIATLSAFIAEEMATATA